MVTLRLICLHEQDYAGVKVGNKVIRIDALSAGKDFVVSAGAGFYFGAGGEFSIEVNISELLRRYF